MDADETVVPSISEPLTWVEICERYPDQQVCLVEIDRLHPARVRFPYGARCGSWQDAPRCLRTDAIMGRALR